MATKSMEAGCLSKVIAGVFTTIVAPVLVNFLIQGITPITANTLLADKVHTAPADMDGPHDLVVSEGRGRSPLEAKAQAVRSALLREMSPLVETNTGAELQKAICEEIIAEPDGFIVKCKDGSCLREKDKAGETYSSLVTVELLQKPFVERLRAVGCLKKTIQ